MRKIHKKLTKDQIERGVIFSSTLSNSRTEHEDDLTQEVFQDNRNGNKIPYLLDDKFFNGSPWTNNIIRK